MARVVASAVILGFKPVCQRQIILVYVGMLCRARCDAGLLARAHGSLTGRALVDEARCSLLLHQRIVTRALRPWLLRLAL